MYLDESIIISWNIAKCDKKILSWRMYFCEYEEKRTEEQVLVVFYLCALFDTIFTYGILYNRVSRRSVPILLKSPQCKERGFLGWGESLRPGDIQPFVGPVAS
jgi:hypothetical protein